MRELVESVQDLFELVGMHPAVNGVGVASETRDYDTPNRHAFLIFKKRS